MKVIRLCFNVLGRFFISLVFLAGAVSKILHWRENESLLMNTFCEWQSNVGFSDGLSDCMASLIHLAPLILLAAILFEFLGSLSLLLGIKEKGGAILLILFLLPATIFMHPFWFAEGSAKEMQLIHFLKNLSIMGGLLLFSLQESNKPKNPFSKNPY